MQAVIPAAGAGTRLRPLTADRPKALVDVAGRPLILRLLDALAPLDLDGYVVVVGYRGAQIVEAVGDAHAGRPVTYVEQSARRGLADAVLTAEPAVSGPFLVVNGDNVIDADLAPVLEHHRQSDATATIPVREVSAAEARGTGIVTVEDGRVTRAIEKPDEPPSQLAMTGCWVLEPAVFDACRRIDPAATGELELADAIDMLIRDGHRVDAVPFPGWRLNVNTPADVDVAARRLG